MLNDSHTGEFSDCDVADGLNDEDWRSFTMIYSRSSWSYQSEWRIHTPFCSGRIEYIKNQQDTTSIQVYQHQLSQVLARFATRSTGGYWGASTAFPWEICLRSFAFTVMAPYSISCFLHKFSMFQTSHHMEFDIWIWVDWNLGKRHVLEIWHFCMSKQTLDTGGLLAPWLLGLGWSSFGWSNLWSLPGGTEHSRKQPPEHSRSSGYERQIWVGITMGL